LLNHHGMNAYMRMEDNSSHSYPWH